jgi:hypothetical protein
MGAPSGFIKRPVRCFGSAVGHALETRVLIEQVEGTDRGRLV